MRTSTLEAPRPETCPFCVIGIGHVGHVPAGVVRVGQDYGDRG
jgi:hypothetical protein